MSEDRISSEFEKKFNDHFGRHVGAKLISLENHQCIYEVEIEPHHFNPNGVLHGGVLFSVMDSSQGAMVHSVLDLDKFFGTTAESAIRYKKPVTKGKVRIITKIGDKKSRIWRVRSEAFDETGEQVAYMDATWMLIKK